MYIICDWGSSKLRAFLLDGENLVTRRYESDLGVKTLSGDPGRFAAELEKVFESFSCDSGTEVSLSGMVGSKHGWLDAGYASTPAAPEAIASLVVAPPGFPSAKIIPGLKHVRKDGSIDLMRGEEIQVFGLLAAEPDAKKICLPGTHSKWVEVEDGKITTFRSYLTGDLFAALCEQSIFREQIRSREFDEESFVAGCSVAYDGATLDDLFRLRADYVCAKISAEGFFSYLSGFLIANEIRAEGVFGTVHLCGSESLMRSYSIALSQIAVSSVSIDSEGATVAGHQDLQL